MKSYFFPALTLSLLLIAAPVCPGPIPDRLIGRVIVTDSAKLDVKAKRELAAIAAKINKSRQKGVVKLKGDVPSAASAEEYNIKSVFLARKVETHLKPLLLKRYQVFIAAPRYSGERMAGKNSVEIALYPRELVAGYGDSPALAVTPSAPSPAESASVDKQPVQSAPREPAQSGLLTPSRDSDDPGEVTSKKERVTREPAENPELANELVRKAKARAAAKAKQLQQADQTGNK